MIVFSALVTLLVGYTLLYLINLTIWVIKAAKMTANIPGPKPWPIIGNALMFTKVKTQKDIHCAFLNIYQKYLTSDRIFKIWLGHKLLILVGHYKFIEVIMSNQDSLDKGHIYQYLQVVAKGILTSNGLLWEELRRPLNKVINKKMVESNVKMFHQKALILCKVMRKFANNGKTFNIKHYTVNYTIDTLSLSHFDYDLNELEKEKFNILETVESIAETTYKMVLQFPQNLSLSYAKISSTSKELKDLLRTYYTIGAQMLLGRMNKKPLIKGNEENLQFSSDIFINKIRQDKLSWEDTGRLITDFILAGSDTSAIMLSHALLMLAMFPEHQDAVYKEQVEIFGEDPNIEPNWSQLSQMPHLTKVLKEVMRIFSPYVISRNISNDIDVGNYKLPKNSEVLLYIYSLHRDPQYWSHPEEFYPDHFIPEEVQARPKAAYVPFSSGPRSCPGNLFAMVLMKIAISTVIRKYKLETHLKFKELTYMVSIMLEVAEGCLVRIKPRNICTK